ncbi:hypothetical protein [Steroidobacter gossypii]|uniref:hypothetical protein n=1 Tax=Steroidobacter gossypii TaxID=2805490 RepID=UPI001C3FABEB|nr:hypothetical protein [Steroidobacter gossypii]
MRQYSRMVSRQSLEGAANAAADYPISLTSRTAAPPFPFTASSAIHLNYLHTRREVAASGPLNEFEW